MKRRSSSTEFFPSTSKRRSNYFLFDSLKPNRLHLLSSNNKNKINSNNNMIKLKNLKKSNSIYRKVNTQNYNNKKYNILDGAKIYLKLDKISYLSKNIQSLGNQIPPIFHNITRLYLSNNNIITLEGIEQFANLTHFSISYNLERNNLIAYFYWLISRFLT